MRKGLFLGKKAVGTYNWQAGTAQWSGDVEKKRAQPIPLQPGDQSALLINLAIMRDARPGAAMHYRYVDMGKVRQHDYQAAPQTENVEVGDLSYNALRVYRTNGGKMKPSSDRQRVPTRCASCNAKTAKTASICA